MISGKKLKRYKSKTETFKIGIFAIMIPLICQFCLFRLVLNFRLKIRLVLKPSPLILQFLVANAGPILTVPKQSETITCPCLYFSFSIQFVQLKLALNILVRHETTFLQAGKLQLSVCPFALFRLQIQILDTWIEQIIINDTHEFFSSLLQTFEWLKN